MKPENVDDKIAGAAPVERLVIRGLTLTQPWADLVALGAKRIETRSWSTSYRGLLAIHAATGLGPVGGKAGLREICRRPAFAHALRFMPAEYGKDTPPLALGVIVAVARLAKIKATSMALRAEVMAQTITPNEIEFGDYSNGRFAWYLNNIHPVPMGVKCKGALGLWEVPLDALASLRKQGSV